MAHSKPCSSSRTTKRILDCQRAKLVPKNRLAGIGLVPIKALETRIANSRI